MKGGLDKGREMDARFSPLRVTCCGTSHAFQAHRHAEYGMNVVQTSYSSRASHHFADTHHASVAHHREILLTKMSHYEMNEGGLVTANLAQNGEYKYLDKINCTFSSGRPGRVEGFNNASTRSARTVYHTMKIILSKYLSEV